MLIEVAVEARAQAEGARLSRQALPRWFQLEPGEFLKTELGWTAVRRENRIRDRVFFGSIYSRQTSSCLAFDWELSLVERGFRNPLRWG